MITVLIPAFNRPHLLRVALDSIAKQTYLHYIDKIIVSENGLNENSKAVCEEFDNLNIIYVYQQHQLVVLAHLKWLMNEVSDGYVAFLCDDDWWNLYHIELAVKSLQKYPKSIAYFSNFAWAFSDKKLEFISYDSTKFLSIESSDKNNYDLIEFKSPNIFLTSFFVTPFHYSSIICKASILAQASSILDEVHPTYSDRALWANLSTYGMIVFNPLSTAVIRNHPGQDTHTYSSVAWRYENQNGSLYILSKAQDNSIDLKGKINDIYLKSSDEDKSIFVEQLARIFIDRNHISWFEGYREILNLDERKAYLVNREKSYKVVLGRKILGLIKKIAS